MMQKIFIVCVAGLVALAGFLTVKIMLLPNVPHEIILDAESFNRQLNEWQSRRLQRVIENTQRVASISSHPKAKEAKVAITKIDQLLNASLANLERANAFRVYPDSVQAYLNAVNAQLRELHSLSEPLTTEKLNEAPAIAEEHNGPQELMGVSLTIVEQETLNYYEETLDDLSRIVDIINIRDYNLPVLFFAALKTPTLKKPFVFDPPLVMKVDQKERIRMLVSKEYIVNKLNENAIQMGSWSDNSIRFKLQGSAFQIEALDDEEQHVVEGEYTKCEFDIMAKEKGEHSLSLLIGVTQNKPSQEAGSYFLAHEKKILVR